MQSAFFAFLRGIKYNLIEEVGENGIQTQRSESGGEKC
jgi:hypothetical protein